MNNLVTKRWARGTGQWSRTRVLVVASDAAEQERLARIYADQHDVAVAASPLDVIRRLETDGVMVSTVVLSDVRGSASRGDLIEFLSETYPHVRVILADRAMLGDARAYAQLA